MANWLAFDKIEDWDYAVILGFQYDEVPDEDIAAALSDVSHLDQVNTYKDWEDDSWLHGNKTIPEHKKHAYRVAALVRELQLGGRLKNSISLDTYAVGQCRSCICNGHHRIRAMQYMGMTAGPFNLAGSIDALESLVMVAGVAAPTEFAHLFDSILLEYSDEDITIPEITMGM
jgi:hypothetical protein